MATQHSAHAPLGSRLPTAPRQSQPHHCCRHQPQHNQPQHDPPRPSATAASPLPLFPQKIIFISIKYSIQCVEQFQRTTTHAQPPNKNRSATPAIALAAHCSTWSPEELADPHPYSPAKSRKSKTFHPDFLFFMSLFSIVFQRSIRNPCGLLSDRVTARSQPSADQVPRVTTTGGRVIRSVPS